MLSITLQCVVCFTWSAATGRAYRPTAVLELADGEGESTEVAGVDSECSAILQNGIRNSISKELKTNDFYEAKEMLDKFEDSYTYDQYQEDHKNAEAKKKDSSYSAKISGSYALFGAGIGGSYGVSSEELSESQFNSKKEKLNKQKKAMKSDVSKEGGNNRDERFVEDTVSPEVVSAWRDCTKFQDKRMSVKVDIDEAGQSIAIVFTDKNPVKLATPSALTGFEVAPPMAAKCRVVGLEVEEEDEEEPDEEEGSGEGGRRWGRSKTAKQKNKRGDVWLFSMPTRVEKVFDKGRPQPLYCRREPGFERVRVRVTVFTNIEDAGVMHVDFADMVTQSLADEVRAELETVKSLADSAMSRADGAVTQTQAEVKAVKSLADGAHMLALDAKSRADNAYQKVGALNTLASSAKSMATSAMSKADNAYQQVSDVQEKVRKGVCELCRTCGGQWPKDMGSWPSRGSGHGKECANEEQDYSYLERTLTLCCS